MAQFRAGVGRGGPAGAVCVSEGVVLVVVGRYLCTSVQSRGRTGWAGRGRVCLRGGGVGGGGTVPLYLSSEPGSDGVGRQGPCVSPRGWCWWWWDGTSVPQFRAGVGRGGPAGALCVSEGVVLVVVGRYLCTSVQSRRRTGWAGRGRVCLRGGGVGGGGTVPLYLSSEPASDGVGQQLGACVSPRGVVLVVVGRYLCTSVQSRRRTGWASSWGRVCLRGGGVGGGGTVPLYLSSEPASDGVGRQGPCVSPRGWCWWWWDGTSVPQFRAGVGRGGPAAGAVCVSEGVVLVVVGRYL